MRQALGQQKLRKIYDRAARRYDLQHRIVTAGADQRGRKILVTKAVNAGDSVLDCGSGTGSTALLAARRAEASGKVTLFDLSEGMLEVARRRAAEAELLDRLDFQTGDVLALPFEDGSFDTVLSTYSICPLYDPAEGAREMFRVLKPGGRLGIAHSAHPEIGWVKWLADRVEALVWLAPSLSLGCRPVSVLPALTDAGGSLEFRKFIGVPLWPFIVFVIVKPSN